MPYVLFDPALPDAATQAGTAFAQSTRDNLKAVRDAAILGGGFAGFNLSVAGAVCTGSITANVLTVTAVASGALGVGLTLSGTGISGNPAIASLGTGTGGTGTYNVTHADVAATTVTAVNPAPEMPRIMTYTRSTERIRAALTWGTTGGAAGSVTVADYAYSSDSGANYTAGLSGAIGTKTITYDAAGNVTATAWA